jgi:hypothetical protein
MYPHERSLVKRMQNQPFALLGINSDTDLAQLRKRMKAEHITWPSWWDKSTSGPIATAWNVHAWPTIYVLDAKGIIRFKDVRGAQLDHAVDTLLKEMGKNPPPATQPVED